jgi:hypothetical protein
MNGGVEGGGVSCKELIHYVTSNLVGPCRQIEVTMKKDLVITPPPRCYGQITPAGMLHRRELVRTDVSGERHHLLDHQGGRNQRARNNVGCVRFEVFTAVTMKNGVFWDVTPCGSCKSRRIGGT